MERVKRRFVMATVAIAVISISSCENLLSGNFFEDFDAPPSADDILDDFTEPDGSVSTDNAPDFVEELDEAADSNRFFDDLSADDRDELGTALESVFDNEDVDTEVRQEAAILAGEIALRGTEAGETANNVVDVLTDADGADSFNDPGAFVDAVLPDDIQDDPDAVREVFESMIAAANAYNALGENLTDTDGDGSPDGPDGANMGEVSQNAAISIVLAETADADGDGVVSDAELDAFTNATVNDDFSGYSGNPLEDSLGSDASPTPLRNILDAGGLLEVFESET